MPCGNISVSAADMFESLVEKAIRKAGRSWAFRTPEEPVTSHRSHAAPSQKWICSKGVFLVPSCCCHNNVLFSKSYFSWAYAVAGLSYAHTDKARRSPVFYPGTSTTLQCYVVALCKAAFMTACTAAPLVPRFLVVANTVALVRLRIYLFLRPSSSHV